jgi:sulfatase modifying factor 1
MSGNVWEWVADWYDEEYYATLADGAVNPSGPTSGEVRVIRGGSFFYDDSFAFRASRRFWDLPDNWTNLGGFRCARSL